MSYRAPIIDPRALRRAQQPLAQHANASGGAPHGPLYPLSLADTPQSTALAQPSNGLDLRTLLLLFVAAGIGMWLYKRFFSTKKKMAANETMFFTTAGPLRGLDRIGKRLKQHAELLKRDGYEGIASDLKEASDLIDTFTKRTREQTMEE